MIGALALTVLVFVSTDCPISNRYAPEITRLHAEFAAKGVRFRLVYPNPLDDEAAINTHIETYGYPPLRTSPTTRDHRGARRPARLPRPNPGGCFIADMKYPSAVFFDLDRRRPFRDVDNRGVIVVAFAVVHQIDQHVLHRACQRQRHLQRLGGE